MPELGTKYECYSCGAKFYDLGKPQPICPKCGANQKDAAAQAKAAHETTAHRRRRKEEPVRIADDGSEVGAHEAHDGHDADEEPGEHEDVEHEAAEEGADGEDEG